MPTIPMTPAKVGGAGIGRSIKENKLPTIKPDKPDKIIRLILILLE
jgi:hypothetical protein